MKPDYPTPSAAMKSAMNAQTNLAVFDTVIAVLESGALHGYSGTATGRIIEICRKEQQRLLKAMDKAVAAAQRPAANGAAGLDGAA